jgi:hypothetical protein
MVLTYRRKMKASVKPFRVVKSDFLSDKEAKLAKFCQDNGIKFDKTADVTGRGTNGYQLKFQPNYLDGVERNVVEYCEKNKIPYSFAVDKAGYHHYEFDRMIDLGGFSESGDKKYSNATCSHANMPRLNRSYRTEIDFVESDEDINELRKSIDQSTINFEAAEPKTWKEHVKYWVYPKYRREVKAKRAMLHKQVQDMKDRTPDVLARIEMIETEKKLMRDMLVLAGLV